MSVVINELLDNRLDDARGRIDSLTASAVTPIACVLIRMIDLQSEVLARDSTETQSATAPLATYLELGALYSRLGLPGGALVLLERATKAYPESGDLLLALGDLEVYLGLETAAGATYSRLASLGPEEAELARDRATAIASRQIPRRF